MRQLQCTVRQPDSCESDEAICLQTQLEPKDIGGTFGDKNTIALGKGVRPASYHTKQAGGTDVSMQFETVVEQALCFIGDWTDRH